MYWCSKALRLKQNDGVLCLYAKKHIFKTSLVVCYSIQQSTLNLKMKRLKFVLDSHHQIQHHHFFHKRQHVRDHYFYQKNHFHDDVFCYPD